MTPGHDIDRIAADAAAFRLHAATLLHEEPSPHSVRAGSDGKLSGPSDFDLNPELVQELVVPERAPRAAAVLVPVVARSPLTVLFTLRTPHLVAHAGQVSFPGGKVEISDASAAAAALREAQEEVAIAHDEVEALGFLDTYRTGTGYLIAPLVGLIDPGYVARPDPNEVADVFEVPLAYLMDVRNILLEKRHWQGRDRYFYAYRDAPHYIWGATAGILRNMQEKLFSR